MTHLVADLSLNCLSDNPRHIGYLQSEMVDYVINLIWKGHIAATKRAEMCKIKAKASPEKVLWLLKKFGPLLTIEVDDAPKRFSLNNGLWSESIIGEYEDIFLSSIPTAPDQKPIEYTIRFRVEAI